MYNQFIYIKMKNNFYTRQTIYLFVSFGVAYFLLWFIYQGKDTAEERRAVVICWLSISALITMVHIIATDIADLDNKRGKKD